MKPTDVVTFVKSVGGLQRKTQRLLKDHRTGSAVAAAACVIQNDAVSSSAHDTHWISIVLFQPALCTAYLCAPRAIFGLGAAWTELPLNAGVLDRKLAYAAVLLLVHRLLAITWPRGSSRFVRLWLHTEFAIGAIEAGSLNFVGVGFSPLFFHHAEWAAAAIAIRGHWPAILASCAVIAAMDRTLSWILTPPRVLSARARWAIVLIVAFGLRSATRLYVDGVIQEFPSAGLVANWTDYVSHSTSAASLKVRDSELDALRDLGVVADPPRDPAVMPSHPWNLITIFLEGGQANFSRAWVPDRAELTPNLDQFAARAVRFGSFYNAATPTINALISSYCGVISEIENEHLGLDRGFTRSLPCLSDWLHQAGYYQAFFGGADSRFAGKDLFLFAHQFDEVRGWEDWRSRATQRNEWGLHDTDLVRQAVAALPALRHRAPFHLSLLTLNAHPPGYVAPDCPGANLPPSLLLAIRCTDHAIGRFLDELKGQGYLEDTVIAIVGDHTVLPSAENQEALHGDAEGWFGKLYMALWYPGSSPRLIKTAGYTPDFTPIVLDALNFDPVPAFPLGRSILHDANASRSIVARHFQILDGQMHPPEPNLLDTCEPQQMAATIIDLSDGELLSVCERHKAIDAVDEAAETHSCPSCLR